MLSRDPRDYIIIIQHSTYSLYSDNGFIEKREDEPNKTFWLESVDGKFSRRYSTESAPEWVMQIYKKHLRNV